MKKFITFLMIVAVVGLSGAAAYHYKTKAVERVKAADAAVAAEDKEDREAAKLKSDYTAVATQLDVYQGNYTKLCQWVADNYASGKILKSVALPEDCVKNCPTLNTNGTIGTPVKGVCSEAAF